MRIVLRPVHPGGILRDELAEFGMSASALAKYLDVPENRISGILRGRRGVLADTALRIAGFLVLWRNSGLICKVFLGCDPLKSPRATGLIREM